VNVVVLPVELDELRFEVGADVLKMRRIASRIAFVKT
jgi:hypothetical protein